jgi:hypothetical protein
MLMRQAAPQLRPGAYLIGVAPEAASLSYAQLEALVSRILLSLDFPSRP